MYRLIANRCSQIRKCEGCLHDSATTFDSEWDKSVWQCSRCWAPLSIAGKWRHILNTVNACVPNNKFSVVRNIFSKVAAATKSSSSEERKREPTYVFSMLTAKGVPKGAPRTYHVNVKMLWAVSFMSSLQKGHRVWYIDRKIHIRDKQRSPRGYHKIVSSTSLTKEETRAKWGRCITAYIKQTS